MLLDLDLAKNQTYQLVLESRFLMPVQLYVIGQSMSASLFLNHSLLT